MNELSLQPETPVELAMPASAPPIAKLLEGIVKGGITNENVGVLERITALYEKMQDKDAERQFAAAFSAFQSETPTIVAKSVIPNRGKYEKFEDLMQVLQPLLRKHGFSISFAQEANEGRITETCHLRHQGGVTKSNSFTVRVGRADTETQADCKAATTAKRNALINCLNLVIRQDVLIDNEGDASNEGAFISSDKVQYLKEQIKELGGEAAFLQMAGATKYEEICEGAYPVLARALELKRKAKK